VSQSISINADGSWKFHAGDDGDSRLRDPDKNAVSNYRIFNQLTGKFEYTVLHRVYCRSCGKDGGLSARTAVYIIYLCENCAETNQDPNLTLMPSDEEYRWRQGLPAEGEKEKGIIVAPK